MEIIIFTWLSVLTIILLFAICFFCFCQNKIGDTLKIHRINIESLINLFEGTGNAKPQTTEEKLDAAKEGDIAQLAYTAAISGHGKHVSNRLKPSAEQQENLKKLQAVIDKVKSKTAKEKARLKKNAKARERRFLKRLEERKTATDSAIKRIRSDRAKKKAKVAK